MSGRAAWPLFLHGPAGTGKTCAALCVCDRVEYAQFWTPEELADGIVRGGMDDAWRRLRECDLAVLDELGARERVGDLHYQAVKRFADCREENGRRVAVYVSNVRPERISDLYDDRVASRLLCGTWFELAGKDRRLQS